MDDGNQDFAAPMSILCVAPTLAPGGLVAIEVRGDTFPPSTK